MSKRKTPAPPAAPAPLPSEIAELEQRLALFNSITGDPHKDARSGLERYRRKRLEQYAKRPLRLFYQYDHFGSEWYGCANDDAMHGASVARVLIPPGAKPEAVRAALATIADDYARNHHAAQRLLSDHGSRIPGLPDMSETLLDDIPF